MLRFKKDLCFSVLLFLFWEFLFAGFRCNPGNSDADSKDRGHVESCLIEHPAVADVACIGIPHAEMGEELKALVVPSDATDPCSHAFNADRLLHRNKRHGIRTRCAYWTVSLQSSRGVPVAISPFYGGPGSV